MVNAGAIVVCSLLKSMILPEMSVSEKFDYTHHYFKVYMVFKQEIIKLKGAIKWSVLSGNLIFNLITLQRLCGGEYVGFNNAVFLSERDAADRNYALGFYMRENKCFPKGTNLEECMDYYFQVKYNMVIFVKVEKSINF